MAFVKAGSRLPAKYRKIETPGCICSVEKLKITDCKFCNNKYNEKARNNANKKD